MLKFFTKEIIKPFPVPPYIIFNVDNFNAWFNAPDNGSTYANSGIFLRVDKLSQSHVVDYLEKCYGIAENNQAQDLVSKFFYDVQSDWLEACSWIK
jgi:hypothetical protein